MTASPLWNRNFVIWWLGSAQSALGTALAGIALSFLVLRQTGSAGAMGVNLALSLLPALLSPLFGTLVDRLPILPPLVLGNLLRAALQLGVGIAALRGPVPIEALHLLALLGGLIGAFYGPATMGVVARLVSKQSLQRAGGLMQGTQQSMSLTGLVGGGVLVGRFGSGPALIFDGITFALFAVLLPLVRFPAAAGGQARAGFWSEFRAGLRYALSSPVLWGLPLIALLLNAAFAPIPMLIPKRMLELGAGAAGFGVFEGAFVAGLALGSFALVWPGNRTSPRTLSVLGLTMLGLSMLGLAPTRSPAPMYALSLLMGLASAATNTSIGVIFQTRVAPAYFGRVGSLLNMVGTAGQPLTLLALAPLADHISLAIIFAAAGAVTLAGAAVWASLLRVDGGAVLPEGQAHK